MSDTKRSPPKSDDGFRNCLCCKIGSFEWDTEGFDCHICEHASIHHHHKRSLALKGQAYLRLFKGVHNHRELVKRLVNLGLLSAEIECSDLLQSYREVIKQSSFGDSEIEAFCKHFFSLHEGAGYFPSVVEKFGSLLPLANERMSYAVQIDITKKVHITLGVYVSLDSAFKHFLECKNSRVVSKHPISVAPYHAMSYLIGGIPEALYFNARPPHASFRGVSNEELNHFLKEGVLLKFAETYVWCFSANRRLGFTDDAVRTPQLRAKGYSF